MVSYYTKEDYAKAYTELLEILKHISTNSLNKIPKENLEMYKLEKDNNYKYTYNEDLEFEEQNVSKLTKILIANLYIEYLASEEEKNAIKENDKRELEQLEAQKRNMHNPDNIFENKKQQANNEEIGLTIPKKKNIFKRIFEKIKLFKLI